MKCQKCGQGTFLPFQCPYCGGQFCSVHRLPENHACARMEAARASKQEEVVVLRSPRSYEYSVSYGQPRLARGRVYFSPKEVKHLAVAGFLVMGIGLSGMLYASVFGFADDVLAGLPFFGVFAVILTASFLGHEVAHKVAAQNRGLWAEFRLTMWGAILTLISVISPLFKIISPGTVMVSGSSSNEVMGKVSVAGPTVNIVLSAAFFGFAFLSASLLPQLYVILLFAAFLNAFMALFNLIPVGILDGFKIYSWNKRVWAMVFAASVALTIVEYVSMNY